MERLTEHDGSYLATGFRDVDAATGAKMAQCLIFLNSLPSVQEYKSQILRAIDPKPGDIVADLGCGLGFDVLRFAESVGPHGLAIGVDSSRTLLEFARAGSHNFLNVEFIQGDVHKLPFENGFISSCKVDRTLQHVAHPVIV
jgi:ubiquinone/menaquinone biosynthesis C-methylase UbiE